MNFRPPVGAAPAVVLAVPEHAGQRCHAQTADVLARKQLRMHLGQHRFGARAHEAIHAGQAGPVEQGVQRDAVPDRAFQIERGEVRKLLRLRHGGVDGDAARRQAVLALHTAGAEIGRALKRQPVGLGRRRVHDPETGKAAVAGHFFRQSRRAVVEHIGRERHLARLVALHQMDAHRLLGEAVRVEQLHAEGRRRLVPQGLFGLETNFLDGVEVDRVQQLRVRNHRRDIRPGGQLAGLFAQCVHAELALGPQACAGQHMGRVQAGKRQQAAGTHEFQQVATRAAQRHRLLLQRVAGWNWPRCGYLRTDRRARDAVKAGGILLGRRRGHMAAVKKWLCHAPVHSRV